MNKLSISWKIAITFILTGCTLITFYVQSIVSTYSTIKTKESAQVHLESLNEVKDRFDRQIQKGYLIARNIVALFDSNLGKISRSGESLFLNEKPLRYLELENETTQQTIFILSKMKTQTPPTIHPKMENLSSPLNIESLGDTNFLVTQRYQDSISKNVYRIKLIIDIKDTPLLGKHPGSIGILHGNKVILASGPDRAFATKIQTEPTKRTPTFKLDGQSYLLAGIPLTANNLELISWLPTKTAISPLREIFIKTSIFILMSLTVFSTIALLVTDRLTRRLDALTRSVKNLKEFNFTKNNKTSSEDEIDHLSNAVSDLSENFQHTIIGVEKNAMLKSEMETSRLAYELLLPKIPSLSLNDINLYGATTSFGSGGKWWHYFAKGNDLFIILCESDLRGSAAAMLTSSTRTTFSILAKEDLTLSQLVHIWDETLRSCFQRDTKTTGVIVKINTTNGHGEYLAIGESNLFIVQPQYTGFKAQPLYHRSDMFIGEGLLDFFEPEKFILDPNSSIIVHTSNFVNSHYECLTIQSDLSRSAQDMTKSAIESVCSTLAREEIKNDQIIISIQRKGPRINSYLASEQGDQFMLTTENSF